MIDTCIFSEAVWIRIGLKAWAGSTSFVVFFQGMNTPTLPYMSLLSFLVLEMETACI